MSSTRVIVYTGKGGVGKTTIAAATALLSAERGLRTLVLSTDMAHSLGDVFDRKIGHEPTRLRAGLWAQEPDTNRALRDSWSEIREYIAAVFQWRGLEALIADELAVVPGLDEIASLLELVNHVESGRYDVVVVDAAPTGETIRLLSLPEAARWWLEHIFPIQRRATKLAGPVLRRLTSLPVPDDSVFSASEDLFRQLDRTQRLLADPRTTSMRIVLNLEKVVIAEAWRSFTYFHLFGYSTDLVVCNRVLPTGTGTFFGSWRETQQRYLPTVTDSFAPVPVLQAPFQAGEVIGLPRLRELAVGLFGEQDPVRFFSRGKPYRVERENGGFALTMELPFVAKGEVDVQRNRDELVVQVGPWRRNVILPRALAEVPTRDARLREGVLRVYFESPASASRRR